MRLGHPAQKAILQLLPFSKNGPVHGGKIRSAEIFKKLNNLDFNITQLYLGDMNFEYREEYLIDSTLPFELVSDVHFLNRDYGLSKMNLTEIDIIIFEHPWAWSELKRIASNYPHIKLVYSSHNIEWRLKDLILKQYNIKTGRNVLIDSIYNLEIEISNNVDKIIAVSEDDKKWFEKYSKAHVIFAPNGYSKKVNTREINEKAKKINYGVIVGSAHPPNIQGCMQYLSNSNLWLPPKSKIRIIGSLATALRSIWGELITESEDSYIELIDFMDDNDLNSNLVNANVIILPIPYGAGTNLKTAEALSTTNSIVATSAAFRGYEAFSSKAGVTITDSPKDFKISLISHLLQDKREYFRDSLDALEWSNTLLSLESI